MAAFELAARQGADAIEFDVHLTADGVPVVIHDVRLKRTTSVAGIVRTHRAAELKRLDAGSWFNRRHPEFARARYAGERIPLLSEVLPWVRKRGLRAYLEIKLGGDLYPGIEWIVLREIERAGATPHTTVISFDLPTLARLRKLSSGISLGIDCTRPVRTIRRARKIEADVVLPHWRFSKRRFIRRAHRAGIQVIAWHVESARVMRRKFEDGVDGVVTDWPSVAKRI